MSRVSTPSSAMTAAALRVCVHLRGVRPEDAVEGEGFPLALLVDHLHLVQPHGAVAGARRHLLAGLQAGADATVHADGAAQLLQLMHPRAHPRHPPSTWSQSGIDAPVGLEPKRFPQLSLSSVLPRPLSLATSPRLPAPVPASTSLRLVVGARLVSKTHGPPPSARTYLVEHEAVLLLHLIKQHPPLQHFLHGLPLRHTRRQQLIAHHRAARHAPLQRAQLCARVRAPAQVVRDDSKGGSERLASNLAAKLERLQRLASSGSRCAGSAYLVA
jgi:hypothetical protein